MVFNSESLRKITYLVAGILPATFFGLLSLFLIVTPALFWTIAAWIGIAGLILALKHEPYDVIHAKTALTLIIGVAAMAPIALPLLPKASTLFDGSENFASVLIFICAVSPMLVALHFLYYQASVLIVSWLSMLDVR